MFIFKNDSNNEKESPEPENKTHTVNSTTPKSLIPVILESQNGRTMYALNEKQARIARLADKGAIVAAEVSKRAK